MSGISGGFALNFTDVDHPAVTGAASRGFPNVISATGTTVRVQAYMTGLPTNGDNIIFGNGACIEFDPSSSVVGGATQGIFIGWHYGASQLYYSADGGASFAATTSGGPAHIQDLSVGGDGVAYAVELIPGSGGRPWRYQSSTWTALGAATSAGNAMTSCAADPLNAGHIVFIVNSGDMNISYDHGATQWPNDSTRHFSRAATDVPWLGPSGTNENWMTQSSIKFDPVVSGRLWVVEGIGVWYGTPPASNAAWALTSQNKNQQGLIVQQIVKPPGLPIQMTVQDRGGFRLFDTVTEPSSQWLTTLGLYQGGGVDYAKSDPNFQMMQMNSTGYFSTDAGLHWTAITEAAGGSQICVQSASSAVLWPSASPLYFSGTIGASSTYSPCLFDGFPIFYGWAGNYFSKRHPCCNDGSAYYAYNSAGTTYGPRAVEVAAAGDGYNVGDTLTFSPTPRTGNANLVAAVITVQSLTGGPGSGVATATITTLGEYAISAYSYPPSTPPDLQVSAYPFANPATATSHTGGGAGATFNFTDYKIHGGIWRSTDGGANWSWMGGQDVTATGGQCGGATASFNLMTVPGHPGHLIAGSGSSTQVYTTPLNWSLDGGATWHRPSNVSVAWQAAAGAMKPGAAYPAIYFAGILTTDLNNPGVFRSDDFDPNNPTATPTWHRMCYAPGDDMDDPGCLFADLETYGTFYIACGGTGYAYGKLQ